MKSIRLTVLLLSLCVAAPSAKAGLMLELTGAPGGSIIHYQASGTNAVLSSLTTNNFTFRGGDIYDNTAFSSFFSIVGLSGGFTMSNLTSGATATISSIVFRRDFFDHDRDRMSFQGGSGFPHPPGVRWEGGDLIGWSGTGTFDLAPLGATFDDLKAGSYSYLDGNFGAHTLTISQASAAVPEPSSIAIMAVGMIFTAGSRRRRNRRITPGVSA